MGAGDRIEIESGSGPGWASAVVGLDSRRINAEVVLACPGHRWGIVQAEPDAGAAWPTGLVLTVERGGPDGGTFVGLPAATTITASGFTALLALGRAARVRVRVTTASTAGHGLVRIGVLTRGAGNG